MNSSEPPALVALPPQPLPDAARSLAQRLCNRVESEGYAPSALVMVVLGLTPHDGTGVNARMASGQLCPAPLAHLEDGFIRAAINALETELAARALAPRTIESAPAGVKLH